MRPSLPLAALLLLAACGASPREECLAQATAELETIDRLIAETEGNLLRGYALEPDGASSDRYKLCTGGGVVFSFCAERTGETGTKPVAINPFTERVKLANLQKRREGLAELAEIEKARCEAEHRR